MKRQIIGEGTAGCVHKPSIHCKVPPSPNFDYTPYVSKIMKARHSAKELAEFVIIGKIDPNNEYHLGQPILCRPNIDEEPVKNAIKKCKHIKLDSIEAQPDDYRLLLLKFGGHDLNALCGKHLEKYLEQNKTERTDLFWLEVHHLIKGLKFFKDNNIIHNDIKPQNILFNDVTGEMKYIDFGLMRTKQKVINASKNNENHLGMYHWSYPFDCAFMNMTEYNKYKGRNNKGRVKTTLSELIVSDSKNNSLDLPINRPSSFKILFTYLNPENTIPNSSTQYGYINSFFDGFDKMIATSTYDTVLDLVADSIDVFGLGFTLQYMANCFKRLNALSLTDFTRLSTFFHKMYDFNPLTRVTDIGALLDEYENVLLELGVLTRLKKSFENNNVVNKNVIMTESPPKQLSAALQELANRDPVFRCPEEKEFNPITKRCVKKCKEGFKRDVNFDKFTKCYSITKKTKKNKLVKSNSIKNCSSNKELNPKTNRCVKKCMDGYVRNEKFRCYKGTRRKKQANLNV